MPDFQTSLFVYLNLARILKKQLEISSHNRSLVLASEAACNCGLDAIAQFCRSQVLKDNPGHKLGHFDKVSEALEDEEFQYFLAQIRRRYPIEHAELELEKHEIEWQDDLVNFGTVERYLSHLLGVDYDWIVENF